MTEGEFPFRSFTMRAEGYDRNEVDSYVETLRNEITESRRALETATQNVDAEGDARLHDPEGAVTRTLAIAQETADRVLHDAQVEADRRRSEADEHASTTIAEADERAARLLADMEAQSAEVREQGIAAARSAIQVERDKAMAELAHIRRVRDDLRTEAVDLKSALDKYRSQAREASDSLAAASSGPLMAIDLPDFIDDDVALAGIVADSDGDSAEAMFDDGAASIDDAADDPTHLQSVDDYDEPQPVFADDLPEAASAEDLEAEIVEGDWVDTDADLGDADAGGGQEPDFSAEIAAVADIDAGDDNLADVISIGESHDLDSEVEYEDVDEAPAADPGSSGTFLAEVRAAAEDDELPLPGEADGSDRFLSELRGLADDADDGLDSEAADRFFDDD